MAEPSLEVIYDEISSRLKGFIVSRVEDEATAEDLLQEVFLRIHNQLQTLRDTDRLESWIYQIARNMIIDHHRARREILPLAEELPGEDPFPPEQDAIDELTGTLRELVNELPDPYREALILTEFEGLSQIDLAEKLGISVSGAKSRVQRARQKLRDQLLACCHFEFDHYGRVIDYWDSCCCCCPVT